MPNTKRYLKDPRFTTENQPLTTLNCYAEGFYPASRYATLTLPAPQFGHTQATLQSLAVHNDKLKITTYAPQILSMYILRGILPQIV